MHSAEFAGSETGDQGADPKISAISRTERGEFICVLCLPCCGLSPLLFLLPLPPATLRSLNNSDEEDENDDDEDEDDPSLFLVSILLPFLCLCYFLFFARFLFSPLLHSAILSSCFVSFQPTCASESSGEREVKEKFCE